MIKVEHTKTHTTKGIVSGGMIAGIPKSVLVTEAKLVLVECPSNEGLLKMHKFGELQLHDKTPTVASTYKPILISETEKIESDDIVYDNQNKTIFKTKSSLEVGKRFFKILALPEHFTNEQLQMIVDGELKDGDKVLVECEWTRNEKQHIAICDYFKRIKLNPHITIYPVEEKITSVSDTKMYTKEDVLDILDDFWKYLNKETPEWCNPREWFSQNVK